MTWCIHILNLIFLIFLGACATDAEVKSKGEATYFVRVQLDYIEKLQSLCRDSLALDEFESEAAYNKAVADCTLENVDLFAIDVEDLSEFNDTFCSEASDLSEIPPEDLETIESVCNYLAI